LRKADEEIAAVAWLQAFVGRLCLANLHLDVVISIHIITIKKLCRVLTCPFFGEHVQDGVKAEVGK
jgi:hypothetical protein